MNNYGSSQIEEGTDAPQRRLRSWQFRTRSLMLTVAVVAIWVSILLDPNFRPLVRLMSRAIGITLAAIGIAFGLGLLGFGLCSACDRTVGRLRRASQWPDE
jgi:hypothetical protein